MSEIIRRDFPIEQAGLLTINDVVVAPDLRTATAFVGFVGTPAQRKAAPDRLESRASRFQQILGSHLKFTRRAVNGFKPCLYCAQALRIQLDATQIII
jgi:ribosome-binding factor A